MRQKECRPRGICRGWCAHPRNPCTTYCNLQDNITQLWNGTLASLVTIAETNYNNRAVAGNRTMPL